MKSTLLLLFTLVASGIFYAPLYSTSNNKPANLFLKTHAAVKPSGKVYIIIDKSDYELSVYDEKGWYATYPVVFGANPLEDKKMEGDRRTPEGTFIIQGKKPHDKWSRFMHINYPTKESYQRFNSRKQRGEIPKTAKIGGAIGIHGTWPREDYQIDRYKNWTLGCISMKNKDVEELYRFIPVGTQVTIRK